MKHFLKQMSNEAPADQKKGRSSSPVIYGRLSVSSLLESLLHTKLLIPGLGPKT
jgi:hypothetical protein